MKLTAFYLIKHMKITKLTKICSLSLSIITGNIPKCF